MENLFYLKIHDELIFILKHDNVNFTSLLYAIQFQFQF